MSVCSQLLIIGRGDTLRADASLCAQHSGSDQSSHSEHLSNIPSPRCAHTEPRGGRAVPARGPEGPRWGLQAGTEPDGCPPRPGSHLCSSRGTATRRVLHCVRRTVGAQKCLTEDAEFTETGNSRKTPSGPAVRLSLHLLVALRNSQRAHSIAVVPG